MKRVLAIIALAGLTLLPGCAAKQLSPDYKLAPDASKAVVVYSTRLDDRCGGSLRTVSLRWEAIAEARKWNGVFLVANSLLKDDFQDPPGFFRIQEVDAGQYRLADISVTGMKGPGGTGKLDRYFTLEPGSVYYLGELYVELPDCYRYRFLVNDQMERDRALFDQHMTQLRGTEMLSNVEALRRVGQAR